MAVIWSFLAIALLVYVGFALAVFFGQSRLLFQPRKDYTYTPKDIGIDYENVVLKTDDDHSVVGWYIPAPTGQGQRTVLFCHGNAGNISHRLDTLELIHNLGMNCLIVDYRGYGQSAGKTTEQGTLNDIRAGWDWLIHQKQKSPDSIILFGRSLGGSIAAIIAKDVHPSAVIIESAFTSAADIGKHYYPWLPVKWFVRFDYNTLEAVKELQCPVFVVHSPDDEIVPYRFGKQIFETANEPKLFRDLKGGHNEGFFNNAELYKKIWQDWIDFLNEMANQEKVESA